MVKVMSAYSLFAFPRLLLERFQKSPLREFQWVNLNERHFVWSYATNARKHPHLNLRHFYLRQCWLRGSYTPPSFYCFCFFFLTLFKGLRFILKTLRNALYTMCSSCIMQVFKDLREHPDMLCTSKSQRRTVHFQSAVLFECEHGMSRTSNQNAGIYKSFKIYIQLPGEYCFLFIWYMKQCTEALLITPKNKIKNNGKMKGGEVVTSQW